VKNVRFSLAHLSDVHLGPLPPGAMLANFALKRIVGGLSWNWHRRKLHLPEIAAALRDDIKIAKPNHVAFTGDLLNIAALGEFTRGVKWLNDFGDGNFISFTPGNHDAYVDVPWQSGLAQFAPYMTSDIRQDAAFPFVRLRRNIALIGVNGACAQTIFRAGGTVGPEQRSRLASLLKSLQERGFYRVVMIHHPPAPGLAHPMRALSDAAELKSVLEDEGAELVLHGHNHRRSLIMLESKRGTIPVIGVPSASMTADPKHEPAAWNRYDITRAKGRWHTHVTIRQWDTTTRAMKDHDELDLPPRN
jgi:3',5'-cyclic AMP phosphodiesterase CpdA